jgi:hypothetical protein
VIPEAARAAVSLSPSSAGQVAGILSARLAAPGLGEEARAHIRQALAELGLAARLPFNGTPSWRPGCEKAKRQTASGGLFAMAQVYPRRMAA